MEATAKYDFEGTASEELSFRRGDLLKILQTTGNWYRAELNGVEAFVPKNFLNFQLPSWYVKDCNRVKAKEKLMSENVGAFIIRSSNESTQGHFSISVRHTSDVQHFKVLHDSRGRYYLWSEKFLSLNKLVEYYKKNSISKQTQMFLQEPRQETRGLNNEPSLPASPPPDRPPQPAPREHNPFSMLQVRALYSFNPEENDELEFKAGDIISVLDSSDQTWWRGRLRGRTGLFPSNFTKPL